MAVGIKSPYPVQHGKFEYEYLSVIRRLSFLLTVLLSINVGAEFTRRYFEGESVFQKNCAKCHGKTAEGRHFGGPSLISDTTSQASSDELRDIVSNGKGRMPKYAGKLTLEEIDMLVAEIKAMKKK
jgi:cytochrome c5